MAGIAEADEAIEIVNKQSDFVIGLRTAIEIAKYKCESVPRRTEHRRIVLTKFYRTFEQESGFLFSEH